MDGPRRAYGIEDFRKRSIYDEFCLSKFAACDTFEPRGENSRAGWPWNDYATLEDEMSLSDMRILSRLLAPLRS